MKKTHYTWIVLCFVINLSMTLGFAGCAASQHSADDAVSLRQSVIQFHKNLRWARYEQAAVMTAPSYRENFLGRYEEMGDDFHIVQLEVKKVDFEKDDKKQSLAYVQIEQQWYKEPNMTVKKDKIVETWKRNREGWKLTSRLKYKEWKARQKAKDAKTKPAKPESTPETKPESTPTTTPTADTAQK